MRSVIYFIIIFVFFACNYSTSEINNSADTTALDLNSNNNYWNIDSLELIYNPDASDLKVFNKIIVKDTSFIKALNLNLLKTNESLEECPHHVKMFLFNKGRVFKTIYASDSCNYIAYAQNSNQMFIKMQDIVKTKIDSLILLLQ